MQALNFLRSKLIYYLINIKLVEIKSRFIRSSIVTLWPNLNEQTHRDMFLIKKVMILIYNINKNHNSLYYCKTNLENHCKN